jgi:hypothetical protein
MPQIGAGGKGRRSRLSGKDAFTRRSWIRRGEISSDLARNSVLLFGKSVQESLGANDIGCF